MIKSREVDRGGPCGTRGMRELTCVHFVGGGGTSNMNL